VLELTAEFAPEGDPDEVGTCALGAALPCACESAVCCAIAPAEISNAAAVIVLFQFGMIPSLFLLSCAIRL